MKFFRRLARRLARRLPRRQASTLLVAVLASHAFADPASTDSAAGTSLDSFAPEQTLRWQHPGQPAFSISYPWHWNRKAHSQAPTVLEASEDQVPLLRVLVMDEPWWLPQTLSVRAAASQLEGDSTEVIYTGSTTLADGTNATTGLVRWQMHIGLGLPLHTWFVSAFHGDHWVLASITMPNHGEDFPEDLQAIAESLAFEAVP